MYDLKESLRSFSWDDRAGYGYLPVSDFPYDDAYFDKYEVYEKTEFGRKLNDWRVALVKRFSSGRALDVGIGCGSFVKGHGNSLGYDVCKKAIDWLMFHDKYVSPYTNKMEDVDVVTFFDSFEHIDDLHVMMDKVCGKKIVMSIPVFQDYEDVITSKHFRPNEHFHYFSVNALLSFMRSYKMRCVWTSDYESVLGRESILTFVFFPTKEKIERVIA